MAESASEYQYPQLKECKEVITIQGQPTLCKVDEPHPSVLAYTGATLGILLGVALLFIAMGYAVRKLAS